MQVSRMYCVTQNPSMLITGCLDTICKNTFMFSFMKPSALWIGGACLNRFFLFARGTWSLAIVIIIFLFQWLFAMLGPIFIDFFF